MSQVGEVSRQNMTMVGESQNSRTNRQESGFRMIQVAKVCLEVQEVKSNPYVDVRRANRDWEVLAAF